MGCKLIGSHELVQKAPSEAINTSSKIPALFFTFRKTSKSSPKIYNIDNQLVATSKALKLNLPKGQLVYSSWTMAVGQLAVGTYRVDLVLGSDPVWRSFFRLVD